MWRRVLSWSLLGLLVGWLALGPAPKSGETGEAGGYIDPNGLTTGADAGQDELGGIDPNGLTTGADAEQDQRGGLDPDG